MKKYQKHISRFLAVAIVLVATVSLLPANVSAHWVWENAYLEKDATYDDWDFILHDMNMFPDDKDHTVKIEDYDQYIIPFPGTLDDTVYERVGMGFLGSEAEIANSVKELSIPAFPEKGTFEEQIEWWQTYSSVVIAYAPHTHDLSNAPWQFDNNYHWKNCVKCKNRAFLSWHSDVDNDGKCDFCGNPIHYYAVTVKDAEGGKVTLSADKGAMNARINVTVTPDAGYHLDQIHFYNNNAVHSELTRWEDKTGTDYHFVILNWDIEVVPTFVKD